MIQNKPSKDSDILHALLEISHQLIIPINLKEAIDFILNKCIKLLEAESAVLFILDEHTNMFKLAGTKGFAEGIVDETVFPTLWDKINEQVSSKRKTFIINGADETAFFRIEGLGISSFISAPLLSNDKLVGILTIANAKDVSGFRTEDVNILLMIATQTTIAILNSNLYYDLKNLYISAVQSLAAAIDAKDPNTKGHSERVMNYAVMTAKRMDLSEEFIEDLKLAALMHDVGKIGIPEAILLKPHELTNSEREVVYRHPIIGVRILESMKDSYRFIPGIRDHHERYDGTGYPNRLKAEEISLQGRIIAVCDTFDAMVTERPYQKAFTSQEALAEIKHTSGTHFDPKVAEAFVESFAPLQKSL